MQDSGLFTVHKKQLQKRNKYKYKKISYKAPEENIARNPETQSRQQTLVNVGRCG
jgi:hypothetical protein